MAHPDISKYCTLLAADQPQRLMDWQTINDQALLHRERTASGVTLCYAQSAETEERLRSLAEAETACCGVSGFTFDIVAFSEGEIHLRVEAPASVLATPEAEVILSVLQGLAPRDRGPST
jgi:hypothetical protein